MSDRPLFSERELAEAAGHKLASTDHIAWALKNSSDDPDAYFEWLATWARAGHDSSARDMLHGFCYFYERHETIPAPILHYLWLGFSRHLANGGSIPLEKALGLVAPAHRKKGTGSADPFQIVAYVHLRIRRDRLKKQEALQDAAERFHVTKRHVERLDSENEQIRTLSDSDLERLAQPNAPIPSDNK